jgi:hypothetical protein
VEILWNAFPYRFGRFAHEIQMVMAVYFDQSLFTHGDGLFRIKNIAEIGALRANPVRWEATALPLSYTRPSHNTALDMPKVRHNVN